MAPGRSLHIKCGTWDQVEAFYQRKLRRGNVLSMKVPFGADPGTAITLGLELPNQLLVAIDGKVLKASQVDGSDRTWLEIELRGLTADLLARLRGLVHDGRMSSATRPKIGEPTADELPADERQLFLHMSHELRRLRQLAVHTVLGVDGDADPGAVRRGWIELVSKYHPDVVAPHRSAAISHLAEEILILVNRAYHRMRASLVAEGRATALGPGMVQPHGWLIGFDDLATGDREPAPEIRRSGGTVRFAAKVTMHEEPEPLAPAAAEGSGPSTPPQQGGESFEHKARALLATGDNPAAKEMLAAALCVYPRSRPLRSLYYVASALTALDAGQIMLATSQLEAALAHDEECVEAAAILDQLRRDGASDYGSVPEVVPVTRAIGIDLGTTNSAAAVIDPDGRPRIFTTPIGTTTLPSLVWFADEGPAVGDDARAGLEEQPEHTISGVKRLLGRPFEHPDVRRLAKVLPYELTPAQNGDAWIALSGGERVSPEHVSGLILRQVRAIAERALGEPVREAVVTVPAWFDTAQRQATKDAAAIAGLTVRRLLSEPTAAALGHGAHRGENVRYVVCDLGGGTFDVAVVDVAHGVFEVLATTGDPFLGGDDVDRAIVEQLVRDVKGTRGVDVTTDAAAIDRLRLAAQKAKHELSGVASADIRIPQLALRPSGKPIEYARTLRRDEIELWAAPLFRRLEAPCRDALQKAGRLPQQVDEVLLVGGMTRMPAVRRQIARIFGREPKVIPNPDEVVAIGAAIEVARLDGQIGGILLLDVCARGLALSVMGGACDLVIPSSSVVPTREYRLLPTQTSGQRRLEFDLWEGEASDPVANRHLGRYAVSDLPDAPAGEVLVLIELTLDVDGTVRLAASELVSGERPPVETVISVGLPRAEVNRLRDQTSEWSR